MRSRPREARFAQRSAADRFPCEFSLLTMVKPVWARLHAIRPRRSRRPLGSLARIRPRSARWCRRRRSEMVVVGLPLSLSGEEGAQAQSARAYAAALEELLDIPVVTYDERLTTRMASSSARAGAGAPSDALAAAHLLESFLQRRAGNGPRPCWNTMSDWQDPFADDEAAREREARRAERERRRRGEETRESLGERVALRRGRQPAPPAPPVEPAPPIEVAPEAPAPSQPTRPRRSSTRRRRLWRRPPLRFSRQRRHRRREGPLLPPFIAAGCSPWSAWGS